MKKITLATTLLALLTSQALLATEVTQNRNYYMKTGISAGSVENQNVVEAGTYFDFSFANGYGAQLTLGKSLSDHFSGELELSHQRYDLESMSEDGMSVNMGGDITYTSLMANSIYKLYSQQAEGYFNPYLGLGLGISKVAWNDAYSDLDVSNAITDDDSVIAGQIFIGNQFNLTNHWAIDLAYRYFATDDYTLDFDDEETLSNSAVQSIQLSIVKQF